MADDSASKGDEKSENNANVTALGDTTSGESEKLALDEALREYRALREREYEEAMAFLEGPGIEPEQRAAYEATLPEMLALPTQDLAWPLDEPRYKLHHAMEYGAKLLARKASVDERFGGRLPLEQMYSIRRYALAALHAFKARRNHREPLHGVEQLVEDAAHTRVLLRSQASLLVCHDLLPRNDLRHFDGGVTLEGIACDLFLLAGVLKGVAPRLKFELLTTPVLLMEAEVKAKILLRHATSKHPSERHTERSVPGDVPSLGADARYPDLWEPTLLYARALTLVDSASFYAEIALSEFHNEERDPYQAGEWKPECLFCYCPIERQRHHRHDQTPKQVRERAQFVSSTMTAALARAVVHN